MNTTTAKKSTAKTAASKATPVRKAPAKKAPAKAAAPVKKAPAKKVSAGIAQSRQVGAKHPSLTWAKIVEAKGLPMAELERAAGVPLGSFYRVVKHGVTPSPLTTVRFAEATGQKVETLWAEVSTFLLAEAQAEVKKADAKKK